MRPLLAGICNEILFAKVFLQQYCRIDYNKNTQLQTVFASSVTQAF